MTIPDNWLEQLRAAYPKRDGGGDGRKICTRLINQAIAGGATWETILRGATNYATHCSRKGKADTEFVMMLQTFIGRDWHFEDWASMDIRTPAEKAEDASWAALEVRAIALGFKTVDRSRGLSVARYAIEQAEREKPGLRVVK